MGPAGLYQKKKKIKKVQTRSLFDYYSHIQENAPVTSVALLYPQEDAYSVSILGTLRYTKYTGVVSSVYEVGFVDRMNSFRKEHPVHIPQRHNLASSFYLLREIRAFPSLTVAAEPGRLNGQYGVKRGLA